MTVKYETLIAEPDATLREIYAFLGVPPHETTFEATTEHNQRYFAQWRDMAKNPETSAAVQEWIARYETRCARSDTVCRISTCGKRGRGARFSVLPWASAHGQTAN